jgi:hypothetical protein
VQAAYVGDMLYLLVTYDDPTLSVQRSPFVKKADGTWEKMKDPDDKGGDNNKFYEDKMAMIWNIDDSIFGFNERFSCQAACHAGEPGKPARLMTSTSTTHRSTRPSRRKPDASLMPRLAAAMPTSSWSTASPSS